MVFSWYINKHKHHAHTYLRIVSEEVRVFQVIICILYIYIYIYIYIIQLAWVGFEPTTTEFRSDAQSDWAIRSSVQLALRANFGLYIWYKVYHSFDSQLPNNPKLFWLLLLYSFISAITFSVRSYIKQSIMSVRKGFSIKEKGK